MFIQKKNPTQPTIPPPPSQGALDPFEVDLREALAATRVSELTYDEFLRALQQHARIKTQ